jgi:excisionase family DNA binding protein
MSRATASKTTTRKHRLLDGQDVSLAELDARERAFVADLEAMARQGISYFEIYRAAVGPGSPALGGRNRVDRGAAERPVYRIALDLATRAGIDQGLILSPDHEAERRRAPTDASMISVAQAAELIGISRAAVYKAIDKGTLGARRIGNVTLVDRQSALGYRDRPPPTGRPDRGLTRSARRT